MEKRASSDWFEFMPEPTKGGPVCAVTLGNPVCPLRQQLREDIRGGGFGLTALSGRNDLGI